MSYTLIDDYDADELEEWVGSLRTSVMKLARFQRSRAQRDGLSLPFAMLSMLSMLESEGPMTPTRLAKLSGVRKPSITRSLAALTAAGLASASTNAEDGRQVVVAITDAGRLSLAESQEIVDDWYRDRLARLSASEREDLRLAVTALSRLHDADRPSIPGRW